ncbi:MAG: four helix bundle protein [Saprospiraceae bacterium]
MENLKEYSFETLEVFKEARILTNKIYSITNKFPTEEKYGITNQMRRAVISIISNIAESSSRTSYKDKARFSEISFGSLMEVLSQSLICLDQKYITNSELLELRAMMDSLGYKLNKLKESQLRNIIPKK